MTSRPPVVIDNGTGYTKMGYAGAFEPNYLIPTVIANKTSNFGNAKDVIPDLEFYIGGPAMKKRQNYDVDYPIREGIISNWDNMEKFWQRCIYKYLSCDPEEHYFMLTEPPMNSPENREYTAEILFETFNVPGLYIAVQAVLALCASLLTQGDADGKNSVTGTVIDSGDGVTHVIPVVDGYVIGSCIKHIPLAGRNVTNFILKILRDRGEPLPLEEQLEVAKIIKEKYCYVCPDVVTQYEKFDSKPEDHFRQHTGIRKKTGKEYTIDVGYERFLGPEIFFSPEIFSEQWTTPLPEVVDKTILACPIDCRRQLWGYITLSGGSTLYPNFAKRLKRDIKRKTTKRTEDTIAKYGIGTQIDVDVVEHVFQRFAVWFGGSLLASHAEFCKSFKTKAEYEEFGPRIARTNPVFNQV